MTIKEQLLKDCLHDLTVCQHLHSKLQKKNQDWRPAENMRSTLELMQYLTFIGRTTVHHYLNTPADGVSGMERIIEASNASSAMTFEQFPMAIEDEKREIKRLFESVTDADILNGETYWPWYPQGGKLPVISALNRVVRILASYRHQLFLYAKMCGAKLDTMNNWEGVDSPQTAEHATA